MVVATRDEARFHRVDANNEASFERPLASPPGRRFEFGPESGPSFLRKDASSEGQLDEISAPAASRTELGLVSQRQRRPARRKL